MDLKLKSVQSLFGTADIMGVEVDVAIRQGYIELSGIEPSDVLAVLVASRHKSKAVKPSELLADLVKTPDQAELPGIFEVSPLGRALDPELAETVEAVKPEPATEEVVEVEVEVQVAEKPKAKAKAKPRKKKTEAVTEDTPKPDIPAAVYDADMFKDAVAACSDLGMDETAIIANFKLWKPWVRALKTVAESAIGDRVSRLLIIMDKG